VLAFGGPELIDHPAPITELAKAFPASVVMGCSTSGEILGETLSDATLTVSVTQFEHTRLLTSSTVVSDPAGSRNAGRRLASDLLVADPRLTSIFVLSDGLAVNGSELTLGLTEGSQGRSVVTGGLAGDGDRFVRTWVLVDGEPRRQAVTALGLAGDKVRIGYGSYGGWGTLGPERLVSRSEGNVLFELDRQPALELYRSYLGERAEGLPATGLLFPLAIRVPGAQDRQLVRTILAVDDQAHSMTFAGDIPQGSTGQLMRATADQIVKGASTAAQLPDLAPGVPALAIAISCVGRRLLLGQRTEDELEAVISALPAGTEIIGFYSYGEISPVTTGTCDLLNQTMTITTIQELP
jgi:hypothetical protein